MVPRVLELVYGPDWESGAAKAACGFESRPGDHFQSLYRMLGRVG